MRSPHTRTRFQSTCAFCRHNNAHEETHRTSVLPYLVSTRCSHCGRLNTLGGLTGTPVTDPHHGVHESTIDTEKIA